MMSLEKPPQTLFINSGWVETMKLENEICEIGILK